MRHRARRPRACVARAALLLLVASGCSSTVTDAGPAEEATTHGESFGHVHGLGVDPRDGRLYVASHLGVFRDTERGFERVADRWQDTMAFTVVGPGHFLASGHPDLREDKPAHLGLIESVDAARSWRPLSLEGEADFHVLEPAGARLYGYDSQSGSLLVTEDRESWEQVLTAPLIDVEADPDDPSRLVLTDPRGQVTRLEPGRRPEPLEGSPTVGILDWPRPELLVGLGPAGEVWLSEDGGTSWERSGDLPGPPHALTTTEPTWYAASESGLFSSTDEGRTWQALGAA